MGVQIRFISQSTIFLLYIVLFLVFGVFVGFRIIVVVVRFRVFLAIVIDRFPFLFAERLRPQLPPSSSS
jgi:hypothetical protein